jgi:hypothetical protein
MVVVLRDAALATGTIQMQESWRAQGGVAMGTIWLRALAIGQQRRHRGVATMAMFRGWRGHVDVMIG